MYSAFGVEHGEISKARIPRGFPGGPRATRAQQRTAGRGGPSGPQKVKGAFNRIAEAPISLKNVGSGVGRGLKNTGAALEAHPNLTGAAIVGGGGYAGYKSLSGDKRKKS